MRSARKSPARKQDLSIAVSASGILYLWFMRVVRLCWVLCSFGYPALGRVVLSTHIATILKRQTFFFNVNSAQNF